MVPLERDFGIADKAIDFETPEGRLVTADEYKNGYFLLGQRSMQRDKGAQSHGQQK